jgi:hypothetical protein
VERRPPPGRRERIADDDLETGEDGSFEVPAAPQTAAAAADWLVIDWGGSGEYKVQFEFPHEAAAFFRPIGKESAEVVIEHGGAAYADNQRTFYPNNGQWRINLDARIPVVADGTVKQQASLFTRLGPDHYELELLDEAGRAARLAEAGSAGGVGSTRRHNGTYRRFGWAVS